MLLDVKELLRLRTASVRRAVIRNLFILRAVLAIRFTDRAKTVRRKKVWLFGGSSGKKYGDNSAALYKYVRRNHPEIDVRWVISRKSPDIELARANGKVLFLEDPNAFLYGLLAEVHVISHGTHDVPTCASRFSRALKVRVGHGMTALVKRKRPRRFAFNSLDPKFDLVPVSSEFEAANKIEWGFAKEKLRVTGIARLDELLELSRTLSKAANPRRILFMPTARDWLVGRVSLFESSDYQKNIATFLSGLNEYMVGQNVRMSVFVHPLMWDHFEAMSRLFSLSQIDLLPLNADLQEALVESSLFITDYSSVAWDALYISRPTLFYQFDFNEYFKHRGQGSHLDLKNDLFGPLVFSPETAAACVKNYVDSNFASLGYETAMERWRQRAFVQIDTDNRKRILLEILSGLKKRRYRQD